MYFYWKWCNKTLYILNKLDKGSLLSAPSSLMRSNINNNGLQRKIINRNSSGEIKFVKLFSKKKNGYNWQKKVKPRYLVHYYITQAIYCAFSFWLSYTNMIQSSMWRFEINNRLKKDKNSNWRSWQVSLLKYVYSNNFAIFELIGGYWPIFINFKWIGLFIIIIIMINEEGLWKIGLIAVFLRIDM